MLNSVQIAVQGKNDDADYPGQSICLNEQPDENRTSRYAPGPNTTPASNSALFSARLEYNVLCHYIFLLRKQTFIGICFFLKGE